MSRILLITGGTGTLGSHLVRAAAKSRDWDEVHATYHTLNPNFHKISWHYMDARNYIHPTLTRVKPTCIIHTMAMSSIVECERKKLDAWQVNVKATTEVINYANINGASVVFTSTDLVFDGTKGRYEITDVPSPINFYGDSKFEAENEILENLTGARYVIARLSLLYGLNLNQRLNFFDTMYNRIRNGPPIDLFDDEYRSFASVANIAEALLELATGNYQGIVHLGGPDRMSRYTFGLSLARLLNLPQSNIRSAKQADHVSIGRRPADVSLDISRTKEVIKTRLQSAEEGLRQMFGLQ